MSRKLIVLSVDAMVSEDVEKLKKMPNTRRYMPKPAEIKRVRTIYPTITYPVHTAIATGCYADKTGVFSNNVVEPGRKSSGKWQWFHDSVKVPDIFTAAKRKGLTTAAVFWPVTGNHPDIDWNIDEYWTQSDIPGDTLHDAMARSGSTPEVLDIVDKYEPLIRGHQRQHPYADDFVMYCACEMITRFKPDLLMIHPANIDSYRHGFGLWNDEVDRGIMEADDWIGMLVRAMKTAGTYEGTDLAVISDHGQIDITRNISINSVFVREGLIRLDDKGEIASWDAWVMSGGTSAWCFLRDPGDKAVYDRVYGLLKDLVSAGVYGISEVMTTEEAEKRERLSGPFSFVLETDGYTSFGEKLTMPYASSFDITDYRYGHATHGHLPDKGPQPVFLASGPSFRENVCVERRPIVDETATFAKILGLDMPGIDGVPVDELLK